MTTGFTILFFAAIAVAWIVMGCSFAAAFKAPFVVMFPGLALLLAHTILFDNYEALPVTLIALFTLVGMYLFGLMCLRVIIPKAEEKKPDETAA